MTCRQERRKAERDAAKRTPEQAGAAAQAGAAGAAAALANLRVDPGGGDWTTQNAHPAVLVNAIAAGGLTRSETEGILRQRVDAGDMEAQFSQGGRLVRQELDEAGLSGAAGRTPKVQAGLAHKCTFRSLTRPNCRWSPDHQLLIQVPTTNCF
jgi:hypothetical protein